MIDTADLQAFLGKIEGGAVAVDLLKIGENSHQQYANAGKLRSLVCLIIRKNYSTDLYVKC